MKRYFCTYFDRNYLAKGLALIHSLQKVAKNDFEIFVVCLDEISRLVLQKLNIRNATLIPFHDIEYRDFPLLEKKKTRSLVEYYFTSTPSIILYLLLKFPHIDIITYLDSDIFFFNNFDPIFDELGDNSILLHKHNFPDRLKYLEKESGIYNVGLVSFRNDKIGFEALKWWREKCLEWCYLRVEEERMADQKYLEKFPKLFSKVKELRHPGCALAPWNFENYTYNLVNSQLTSNNYPIIFVHFHSLEILKPTVFLLAKHPTYRFPKIVLQNFYLPYLNQLTNEYYLIDSIVKELNFGFTSGLLLSNDLTYIIHNSTLSSFTKANPQFTFKSISGEWYYNDSPQVIENLPNKDSQLKINILSEDDLFKRIEPSQFFGEIKTIFVIGAHRFQEYQLITKKFVSLQHIILFEPLPPLFSYLKKFELIDKRVKVFPFAISDVDGISKFYVTNNDMASSSLLEMAKHKEIFPEVNNIAEINVQTKKLSTVIFENSLPIPDLLFIDAQGAEYKILSSIPEEILREIKIIYTEASKEELYQGSRTLDELIDLLNKYFDFIDFYPLTSATPTHGNALFYNRNYIKNNEQILVSAIVSTYNSEKFIEGCLEDLINQTLFQQGKLEIIVVDSASQQNEETIVKKFQSFYPGQIKYIRTEIRETIYSAWNRAIQIARGQYITNANTDDRHRSDALEIMANFLEKNPKFALVYSDQIITTIENQKFEECTPFAFFKWPDFNCEILLHIPCVGPQPMWRKSLHKEFGLFDANLKIAGDYEWWLRIAGKYDFFHINELLGLYYLNPNGLEHSNQSDCLVETEKVKNFYLEKFKVQPHSYDFPPNYIFPRYHKVSNPYTFMKLNDSENPLVSVVIPCFNLGEFVIDAINSIIHQTYKHFEIIVINDGSTDNTSNILKSFINKNPKINIKIIETPNSGAAHSRNLGILKSTGKLVLPLDADDILDQTFIEKAVNILKKHPEVSIVYSDIYEFGNVERLVQAGNLNSRIITIFNQLTCTALFYKNVWDRIGGYDEEIDGFEDWDFWISAFEHSFIGYRIAEPLFYYRKRANSKVNLDNKKANKIKAQIILKHSKLFSNQQRYWAKEILANNLEFQKINIPPHQIPIFKDVAYLQYLYQK